MLRGLILRDLKAATGRITCRENNTRDMWQGNRSMVNYRPDANRTVLQDTILPDNLNKFYARFD